MDEPPGTRILLQRWHGGDADARDRLIGRLYPHLVKIAAARLRQERDTSLSSGDLVNDAVLGLMRLEGMELADRAHVMALASRMMRNILVDRARAKRSSKRQHVRVEITSRIDGEHRFDLNDLESALIRLGAIDSQLMELVEMRYFGGMTVEDIAELTGLSEATIKRRWNTARAWLVDALDNPIDHD